MGSRGIRPTVFFARVVSRDTGLQLYGNDGTAPPNLELYIATAVLASGTIVGGIVENRACIVWGLLYTPEELEP